MFKPGLPRSHNFATAFAYNPAKYYSRISAQQQLTPWCTPPDSRTVNIRLLTKLCHLIHRHYAYSICPHPLFTTDSTIEEFKYFKLSVRA
jgi:hypothetical protein